MIRSRYLRLSRRSAVDDSQPVHGDDIGAVRRPRGVKGHDWGRARTQVGQSNTWPLLPDQQRDRTGQLDRQDVRSDRGLVARRRRHRAGASAGRRAEHGGDDDAEQTSTSASPRGCPDGTPVRHRRTWQWAARVRAAGCVRESRPQRCSNSAAGTVARAARRRPGRSYWGRRNKPPYTAFPSTCPCIALNTFARVSNASAVGSTLTIVSSAYTSNM